MYRDDISAYIDSKKEEMIADVAALVRINSEKMIPADGMPFGTGPAKALEEMIGLMERYGLKTRNYDNYAIAGDFGPGEKELDILAHLDVVPASDEWTITDPFTPLVRDGRIYGRGTSDDKGPAVAALYAIRAVKELGIPLKKSVRLICGSDEECGSSDLKHYYGIEKEAPCTFTPDASFPLINIEKGRLSKPFEAQTVFQKNTKTITELHAGVKVNVVPAKAQMTVSGLSKETIMDAAAVTAQKTNTEILVEEAGEDLVRIVVKGQAAHASLPELGNNAITALLALVCELPLDRTLTVMLLRSLAKYFPHGDTAGAALGIRMEDEKSGALTINLGLLHLEDDILYGEYDVRSPICATDDNLTAVIRNQLDRAGFKMAGGDLVQTHFVSEDSEFVRTLLHCYESFAGKEGNAFAVGGQTYVHTLERGVAFGCEIEGVDNHMHGDDEFMEIDTLLMSAKIFAYAIAQICG